MLRARVRSSCRSSRVSRYRHSAGTSRQPHFERRVRVVPQAAAADQPGLDNYILPNGTIDYYELLGVDDNAGVDEIKKAYRALAKECHPDYLGDEGHNICILLNEAYDVLNNPAQRARYDAELEESLMEAKDDYTGELLSKWIPTTNPKMAKNEDPAESRGVFVDELTCIGCRNCVYIAPACFRMEPEHNRSRVFAQWLNTEEQLQDAIDSCPVSCIHWVQKAELPALEYVTQNVVTERPLLMAGMGGGNAVDVFDVTRRFVRQRQELAERKAAEGSRKYSAAQEAARRQAAESLLNQSNWFQSFSQNFAGSFAGMFNGVAQAAARTVYESGDFTVGSRKRRVRWDERDRMGQQQPLLQQVEQGYSVPPERALVPISVYVEAQPSLLRKAGVWERAAMASTRQ